MTIIITVLFIIFLLLFIWYKKKVYRENPVDKYFEEKPPKAIKTEIVY
jgi:uncharacterized protein YxeA